MELLAPEKGAGLRSRRAAGEADEMEIRNSVQGQHQPGFKLGIRNTKARLKHLYADEAVFSFNVSAERIASARLLFPALEGQKLEITDVADEKYEVSRS